MGKMINLINLIIQLMLALCPKNNVPFWEPHIEKVSKGLQTRSIPKLRCLVLQQFPTSCAFTCPQNNWESQYLT